MTSKPIIAIVDDDDLARTGTGGLMRSLGYDIATFASAEDFLRSDPTAFDCLVLDLQMPGMSGLALQKLLASSAPRLPVIIMAAFPNDAMKALALRQGARQYLEKPCSADELCSCVADAVGRIDPM